MEWMMDIQLAGWLAQELRVSGVIDVDFDAPCLPKRSAAANRMKGHVRTWDLGGRERERERAWEGRKRERRP